MRTAAPRSRPSRRSASARFAASSGIGAGAIGSPAQTASSPWAKDWVAGTGDGVNFAPLVAGHLGHDARRDAEAVDSQPQRVARHAQGTVADLAGAQERDRLRVAVAVGQGEAGGGLGLGELSVAAV
jgi:hypothetical protein